MLQARKIKMYSLVKADYVNLRQVLKPGTSETKATTYTGYKSKLQMMQILFLMHSGKEKSSMQ